MKRLLSSIILLVFCVAIGICGINKTLNAAQSLYQSATTISEYQNAKKKFQSAKSDVGYVATEHDKAINEGIKKCDKKINELTPRLVVNGNSSTTNISFSASGGNQTLTISTNQGGINASALPSWITVNSISSSSASIYCSANTSTSSRSDWFNINAGSKTVRINVSQSGKKASSSSSSSSSQNTANGNHSANIESVWIEQNVTSDGKEGIYVHAKFTVAGMNGKDGKLSTYYYDYSNNAIKDTNGSYCTNGSNPVVAASTEFKPGYDNARYDDYKVFIPYSELHQTGTSSRTINVSTLIWDYSTSDPKQLARKDGVSFSFTPKSDSYLKVDSKTAVSTTFSSSGGTETFYISTDADSWTTWGIPSFCEVTNKTSTSFTLKCNPNSTGSERSDYMKVKTGNHEVRIDIKQQSGSGAKINRIWVDHNIFNGGQKGMMIHIDFEVNGLKNHTINPVAYFYYSNGNRLNDYDGYYRTTDGQVSIGDTSNADYEGTQWKDFKLFMPYNQLHMGTGSYDLKFQIEIHDKTSGKSLLHSDYQGFTFSR